MCDVANLITLSSKIIIFQMIHDFFLKRLQSLLHHKWIFNSIQSIHFLHKIVFFVLLFFHFYYLDYSRMICIQVVSLEVTYS